MLNRLNMSGIGLIAAAVAAIVIVGSAAMAQTYPPARVRVAERGLAERQLLETLRNLVKADPAQLATRVDLMIAAYAVVNQSEEGDEKLAGRITAVEKAFETYQQAAVGTTKPTEGAMNEAFKRQLDNAMANLDQQPIVRSMDDRIRNLEQEIADLNVRMEAIAARPAGEGANKKEKALAVGGMAATIASVLLLAR